MSRLDDSTRWPRPGVPGKGCCGVTALGLLTAAGITVWAAGAGLAKLIQAVT